MKIEEKQELYLKDLLSYKKEFSIEKIKDFELMIYDWLKLLKLDSDSDLITIIHSISGNMIEIEILIPYIQEDFKISGTEFVFKKELHLVNALKCSCIGTEEQISIKGKEFESYIINNNMIPITPIVNYKKKLNNNIMCMEMYVGLNPNII